jgi:hypothetical protein
MISLNNYNQLFFYEYFEAYSSMNVNLPPIFYNPGLKRLVCDNVNPPESLDLNIKNVLTETFKESSHKQQEICYNSKLLAPCPNQIYYFNETSIIIMLASFFVL